MKAFKIVLSVSLLAILLTYSSCSKKHSTPEPITDQQLDKLVKTWVVSSVSLDGQDKTSSYTGFTLVITGTKGTTSFAYTTTARPASSPWPGQGTWIYGTDPTTQIMRDAGTCTVGTTTPDTSKCPNLVSITYAVTATTLQLNFAYSGTGYANTKTSVVSGQWVFNFTAQ